MTLPLEELSVAATAVPVSPGEEGSRWWAGNSIAARLARGIGWSVFAAAGSRAIALGCSIGLARILGREHYGELGVIQTTITTFQVFAAFGLGLTASKFMAELRHTDPSRAGRIAALSG